MNIDFGLNVTYDGKYYTLMCPDNVRDYPVGGLICEYCSLHPTKIKDIILKCCGLNEPTNADTLVTTLTDFHKKLFEVLPPVTATMISLEFQSSAEDWMKAIRENCVEQYTADYFKLNDNDQVQAFILKDTGYESFGCETVLQTMLSAYQSFATTFIHVKYMFYHIVGKNGDSDQREKVLNAYSDFYGDMIDMQHIDFRVLATKEKGLESLYTIKTSLSLLLFEMAHATQNDQQFVVCQNCDAVFVPEGRSDTIYCSYPSPQNEGKTCKEIGAQVARANKEKTDVVTGAYRKAYMRYKMMTKRHPYDRDKRKRFDELTDGMKEWRVKLADGTATTDEFMEWLEQF